MGDEPTANPDPARQDAPLSEGGLDATGVTPGGGRSARDQARVTDAPAAGPGQAGTDPASAGAGSGPAGGRAVGADARGQAGIDALLAEAAAEGGPAADDSGEVTQADVDVLKAAAASGAATTSDTVSEYPETDPPEADTAVGAGGGDVAELSSAGEPDQRLDSSGRPFDAMAAAMAAAIAEEQAAGPATRPGRGATAAGPVGEPLELADFTAQGDAGQLAHDIGLLRDVNLQVKIELGRTRMLVEDVLKLNEGSVVELDKLAGDPVDIFANDRLIARGEVLVLNDNFCVRVGEILSGQLSQS